MPRILFRRFLPELHFFDPTLFGIKKNLDYYLYVMREFPALKSSRSYSREIHQISPVDWQTMISPSEASRRVPLLSGPIYQYAGGIGSAS